MIGAGDVGEIEGIWGTGRGEFRKVGGYIWLLFMMI